LPVVLIESTVWLQGLPHDIAFEAMNECSDIIRQEGVIPAVSVLAEGQIQVGVSSKDLKHFLSSKKTRKVNIRDIPAVLTKREVGGTTVSTTLFIADRLNIPVCLTGGIGGVHRQANESFDISADLQALASYSVNLVSAGIKSVLDIPATLEVLETLGVPVLAYKTDYFPSFYYCSDSANLPERVNSAEEIAKIYRIQKGLGLNKGILIANPIPEEFSLSSEMIDELTTRAMFESKELGIKGKQITPFLLERLSNLTGGESVKANIALLKNNASLASKLASVLSCISS
jgi:pseudouridine-5'-phosphate glycosidase